MTTADRYRSLRAQYPDMGALSVWRWASTPQPHMLDWSESGDASIGRAVIDGWAVKATIREDYEVDLTDTYGTLTNDHELGAFENPYWREWHHDGRIRAERAHDGLYEWCNARHDDDGAARWYVDASGETFEDLRAYYRHRMSRHDAYTRALADYRQRADDARRAYADRYGQGRYSFAYVSVEVSLAGLVVSEASYGGYSWARDYSKPLDPQLDAIVDDAVREALANAPNGVNGAVVDEIMTSIAHHDRAVRLRETFDAMGGAA